LNRFKFRFLIAPFVFLGLLTNTGFAGPISRFVVVVPVYRELYSQNIGLLVRELYAQNLTGLPFSKVDVYFVVNHTVDASEDAKIENRETIEFLNELAAGRSPKVNPAHQILKDVTQNHISSRLNIHVVDLTRPGLRERNIGTVRDIGLKEVLKTVPAKEQANTIIAQMDGDTRVLKDYVKGTIAAFDVENLAYAFLTLRYGDEPEAVARVYQRKIITDYVTANGELQHALDNEMPGGGGPRIAATAEAMIGVDGVPHSAVGEDRDLIEKLKIKYPGKGRVIGIPVYANYRAREDSYDGKHYLQQLDNPIEFRDLNRDNEPLLKRALSKITKDRLLNSFYSESYEGFLKDYSRTARRLKNLIGVIIEERRTQTRTIHPSGTYPELLGNPWFTEMIDADLAKFGDDHEKIIAHLTQEFPFYLSVPPREETLKIAQAQAATETLLIEPYIYAKDGKSAYLAVEKERMPKFSKAFEEYYLQDLKSRWGNLSPEDFAKLSEKDGVNALRELRTILGAADTPGLESPVKEYARKVATKYLNAISGNPPAMGQAHDLAKWVNFSPAVPTEGELRQLMALVKKACSSYDHYSSGLHRALENVLPKINSAHVFTEICGYHSDYSGRHSAWSEVSKWAQENVDLFVSFNPSIAEAKELEKAVSEITFGEVLVKKMLPLARDVNQYLALFVSPFPKPNENYLNVLDDLKENSVEQFLGYHPRPTPEQIEAHIQSFYSGSARARVRERFHQKSCLRTLQAEEEFRY
jgi:hypothetical protein